MEIRIFITSLKKYNEGTLVGKWLEFPLDEEELQKEIKSILGNDEEYFITDYEAPFRIEEYENIFELNNVIQELEELDEHDRERIFYLSECKGYSIEQALEKYEDVIFYQGMTLEDVTYELVDEGIFGNLSDSIKCYIDYEKLARDLSIDGYDETEKGTFWYL